jgi:DNA-binding XRE family transcriptional regulator
MTVQTLHVGGKEFVVIEREEYDRLIAADPRIADDDLPALPVPDAQGNVPAGEYGRKLLARRLVMARKRAGMTQAELARRARIRVETLNRLEKGRHNPDESTYNKLESVLRAKGVDI